MSWIDRDLLPFFDYDVFASDDEDGYSTPTNLEPVKLKPPKSPHVDFKMAGRDGWQHQYEMVGGREQYTHSLCTWPPTGELISMEEWNKKLGDCKAELVRERAAKRVRHQRLFYRENSVRDNEGRRVFFWSLNGGIRFNPKRTGRLSAGELCASFIKKEMDDEQLHLTEDVRVDFIKFCNQAGMTLADAKACNHVWVKS